MKILEHFDLKLKVKDKILNKKILAIDPSSKHYAFSVLSGEDKVITLHGVGKVDFPKKSLQMDRCKVIQATLPLIIETFQPNMMLVEESIWIQNPNTSRTLAYIVGTIMQQATIADLVIDDVAPFEWKPFIGYKNVTAKEKASWGLSTTETNKKASFERKNRVAKIIWKKFPELEIEDTDILDSIGIGLYGLHNF